jgi:hypothetical protein
LGPKGKYNADVTPENPVADEWYGAGKSGNTERYAKPPIVILLRRADLPFPRSSILKMKGFA